MNINTNCNLYKTSFKAQKGNKDMQNIEEDYKILTKNLFNAMNLRVEREVPENGKFMPIAVSYKIPESQNIASCTIKYDPLNPKELRRLFYEVQRNGTDRTISEHILKGTKKEILEYLKKEERQTEFINSIKELSKETDDYYN